MINFIHQPAGIRLDQQFFTIPSASDTFQTEWVHKLRLL